MSQIILFDPLPFFSRVNPTLRDRERDRERTADECEVSHHFVSDLDSSPTPQTPSISALLCAKNSLRNFNGFAGSLAAKYFMASSRCGVTFWFR